MTVIWQAITCNVCGAEKHQTNHWFISYEESGELRIAGWNSPQLLSPGTKHLCGERCLHKLINQFLSEMVNKAGGITTEQTDSPTLQAEPGGPASKGEPHDFTFNS